MVGLRKGLAWWGGRQRRQRRQIAELQNNWEGFAQLDPLWAICADPTRKGHGWSPDEFFATGETEISRVLRHAQECGFQLNPMTEALDFGCGVGRLTQALAGYFTRVYGIDISPTMIRLANEFNTHPQRCHYLMNESAGLSAFPNDYFHFTYTALVLQHMQLKLAKSYLKEFVRTLNPRGMLVFELPRSPLIARQGLLMPGRTRPLPVQTEPAVESLGRRQSPVSRPAVDHSAGDKDYHMEMNIFPESEIVETIHTCGARIISVGSGELFLRKDHPYDPAGIRPGEWVGWLCNWYYVTKCS